MKLPAWDWSEARKQFEMRIPGLVKTRLDTIRKVGHAWQERVGSSAPRRGPQL